MAIRNLLKRLASTLPIGLQSELKRWQYSYEVRTGRFFTNEKEFQLLNRWIRHGDWVVDVGANIGHYAVRMSALVGANGRVIAFEPVPSTFALLAATTSGLQYRNVTLLNAAASESVGTIGMAIPKFETGLDNFYMAHVTNDLSQLTVFTIPIDSLDIPSRVSVVKIDAEGHDLQVIRGMRRLLERDHPVVIVESTVPELDRILSALGYAATRLENSSNVIYESSLGLKRA